jgi:hypothetical protein
MSNMPEIAMYPNAPFDDRLPVTVVPAKIHIGRPSGIALPSILNAKFAPLNATTQSHENTKSGPTITNSMIGASSLLPTRALAIVIEFKSAAPETETP